jgi:hypothetical protein
MRTTTTGFALAAAMFVAVASCGNDGTKQPAGGSGGEGGLP